MAQQKSVFFIMMVKVKNKVVLSVHLLPHTLWGNSDSKMLNAFAEINIIICAMKR